MNNRIAAPGPHAGTIRLPDGSVLSLPADWLLLPPGDAALTRRVKAAGDHWVIQERKGRRIFTRGLWAPADTISSIRSQLEQERGTESFARRKAAAAVRREKTQTALVEDFTAAVLDFLQFHPTWTDLAQQLATAVARHATPVGSGTVARTRQIPVERRAAAAVIAWMRHQTTAYDCMVIPRVKGKRREIRQMLAKTSRQLLSRYRNGEPRDPQCPLYRALNDQSNQT